MIANFVKFQVKPGRMSRFIEISLENSRGSIGGPGCVATSVFEDPYNPGWAYVFEVFVDRAAFERHHRQPYYEKWEREYPELIVGSYQLTQNDAFPAAESFSLLEETVRPPTRVFDLSGFVEWIDAEFRPMVEVGPGAGDYARRVGDPDRELYGCADMACILYTIDRLRPEPIEREQWLEALQSFQDPGSGWLLARTASLSKVHNTAFAIGAMNLFERDLRQGVLPRDALAFARNFDSEAKMRAYLETLDWKSDVYHSGENSVGLLSIFTNVAGVAPRDLTAWFIRYCEERLFDPANGMVGECKPPSGDRDQIGGTFHFAFLWEAAERSMPYPDRRADAILGMQLPSGLWDPGNPWWLTFDAIYMLGRIARETSYRRDEIRAAVRRGVAACYAMAMDPGVRRRDFCDAELGVHTLTGAISLFAAAQQILGPEAVRTPEALKLVLDRRPYI